MVMIPCIQPSLFLPGQIQPSQPYVRIQRAPRPTDQSPSVILQAIINGTRELHPDDPWIVKYAFAVGGQTQIEVLRGDSD